MKTKRLRYAGLFIVLIALAMLACNFPGFADESITETQFTTLEPGLTIVFPTATLSIKETSTPEITPTESIVEGEDGCTLRAAFVDDVTIPDDTVIEKNAEFVKTWRIRNSGTCRWESGTTLVFLSGDQFSDVDSLNVPETEPGDEIEIGM